MNDRLFNDLTYPWNLKREIGLLIENKLYINFL